jgi:superfamily I DNA/RNA helicase
MAASSLTDGLNDAQREAVLHTHGPLLVLAGAGSGKTRVVTLRIARLLAEGESPRAILAVTFTNKAAKEMKERLLHLAGRPARQVLMSTFHALCARLLRRDAHRIDLSPGFTILDEGDQLSQLGRVAKARGLLLEEKQPKLVLSRIGLWKNQGLRDASTMEVHDPIDALARDLFAPYQSHLRALSALDFDDLLLCARDLLERVPDVRKRYQALFKYVHVDEYQDTNPLQFDLVRLLVGPHKNLCVVGDDDQAIYGFRGASLDNILGFDQHYSPCTVVKLEHNYRSTGNILKAANAVIRKNSARRDKTLIATLDDGAPIDVIACDDGDAEAEVVGGRVYDAIHTDGRLPDHIALLVRAGPQTRPFEEALRMRGVPYRVIGGQEFFQRREVKDTLAYLTLLVRPDDENAFRRVVNLPARGLGEKAVQRLIDRARELKHTLVQQAAAAVDDVTLDLKLAQKVVLARFGSSLLKGAAEQLRGLSDEDSDLSERARKAIDDAGLRDALDSELDLTARARFSEHIDEVLVAFSTHCDRLLDAAEAPDLAESWLVQSEGPPLAGFLDRIALDDEERERDKNDKNSEKKNKGKVQIMSLHASKGLEFPLVFMVGFEEGLLPHRRVLEESGVDGVSEERRLCYVGITRAREKLVLTYAKARKKRREMIPRKPSRFLEDIPAEARVQNEPPPVDSAASFFALMNQKLGTS